MSMADREREGGEPAWSHAELFDDADAAPRRAPRRQPGEAPGILAVLILVGIVAGAGIVVWQLIRALRG
jgi:hypothetical protein